MFVLKFSRLQAKERASCGCLSTSTSRVAIDANLRLCELHFSKRHAIESFHSPILYHDHAEVKALCCALISLLFIDNAWRFVDNESLSTDEAPLGKRRTSAKSGSRDSPAGKRF